MRVGDVVAGRYRIAERLGDGAHAAIYKAIDQAGPGSPPVAIKVIRHGVSDAEAALLATLSHPCILRYRDHFRSDDGRTCLVTDLAEGGDVAGMLQAYPAGLPPDQVRQIVVAVAEALAYLHERRIVHRDVKPLNVFIVDNAVQLGDVGIAWRLDGETASELVAEGSSGYAAPEVFRNAVATASDVYALGIMAFELLSGRLPFDGTPEAVMKAHLQSAPPLPDSLPPEWQVLLRHCLDKDPQRRWQAADILHHLTGRRQDRGRALTVTTPLAVVQRTRHRVLLVDREGAILWASPPEAVQAPHGAVLLDDGRLLIADTGRQRIVVWDPVSDTQCWSTEGTVALHGPRAAQRLPDGHTLIADTGNQRLIEVDATGRSVWHWQHRDLKMPVDCQRLPNGDTLVTDWAHHTVMVIDGAGNRTWQYGETKRGGSGPGRLHHPEMARRLDDGHTLICDGRNQRVLDVSPAGDVVWVATGLSQPTQARRVDDTTLVVYGGGHFLVALDGDGGVRWRRSLPL